jgi:hypothetical protein
MVRSLTTISVRKLHFEVLRFLFNKIMFASKRITSLRGVYSRAATFARNVRNASTEAGSSTSTLRQNVPTIGLVVGCCALTFQVFILYPWHHELSEQFDKLQVSSFSYFISDNALSSQLPLLPNRKLF